jgi:hypothetical protein
MHNIGIMHQEHHVAKSIVMMCMNFLKKSTDNKKVTKDLAMICHWPSLELAECGTKAHALSCLKEKERI